MSLYSRLQFDFTPANNDVLLLSDAAKDHLNTMPSLMTTWQQEDIANGDTDGYFKNPVSNTTNTMIVSTTTMKALTNTSIGSVKTKWGDQWIAANSLFVAANSFSTEITLFLSHTNNVSGVSPADEGGEDSFNFPYYESATGLGKLLMYLTHQSDGILNTSPTIGSMTSLFIEDELDANLTIVVDDLATINDSFSIGTGTYSLSNAQIEVIETHIETANNLVGTRRNHDVNFFRNAKGVIEDYGKVSKFSNMGATETKLTSDYIGTDKLKERLANT